MKQTVVIKENLNNISTLKKYLVYIVLFAIFVFKLFFYMNENFSTPDTRAQLSYAVYMELHPEVWIPDFADRPMYSAKNVSQEPGQITYLLTEQKAANYLGHPTLYYKVMALFDNVYTDSDGNLFLDFTKLRTCNILISSFSMLLILTVGYKLITKQNGDWYTHFLFVAIATSLPLYGYVASSVNNDNLCNLGLVIVWIGLLNYVEKGYSYKTFWLVALGLFITVFSKVTAGIIALVAVIVMVLVDIIKTKKIAIVLNKYFATTLPVYAIILHYFLTIRAKYGVFQPGYGQFAPKDYVNSSYYVAPGTGEIITFWEDVVHHFGAVWNTWCSTYNSSYSITRDGINAIPYAIVLIMFIISTMLEVVNYVKRRGKDNNVTTFAFALGVIALLLAHFYRHYKSHSVGKYAGGSQGRYYMPIIPIIAIGSSQLIILIKQKGSLLVNRIGKYIVIAIGAALIYLDFFYFVIKYYQ